MHGKRDAEGDGATGGERERVAVVYGGESDKDSFAAATAYAGLKNAIDPSREYVVCAGDFGRQDAAPTDDLLVATTLIILDRCHPYGAASTFVYEMYTDKGCVPDVGAARLLCAGIIYATDFLRAEKTSREDRVACASLANIAGLDIEALADEIFSV